MDSLTHIAVGACIGELFLGKKIGKKALLYGAVAASLPDIDFVAGFWLNTTDDLMAHRGITHSILFAAGMTLALAWFFAKRHHSENIPLKRWICFLGTEIFFHLFLDTFNAYGIGLFEPFVHRRISFNSIFVADPFFSLWPVIAACFLIVKSRFSPRRSYWAVTALFLSSLYFIYCISNKLRIDEITRKALANQHILYNRYFTTPTPFNSLLWYIVAQDETGYYIGYRSVFDKKKLIGFRYFPRQENLLTPYANRADIQQLIRFSKGYYTADVMAGGLVFNDLRFGQMKGWEYPDAHFVFHYFVQDPADNRLVLQRSRFANWDMETIRLFLRRMRGN